MLGGEPVGLLKVLRSVSHWELLQLQLAPAVQGAGIGSQIIRSLINQARAADTCLRLHVLKAGPACLLYKRLGFAVVAEKKYSYEIASGASSETN
jgi:ribosomal protein S18 acetylase RimI-like enzyme